MGGLGELAIMIDNILVQSEANRPQVVGILHFECGDPDFLNRRDEDGEQNQNDGDDDEQFDKRETVTNTSLAHGDTCDDVMNSVQSLQSQHVLFPI